jgi:L,D-transpeptidase catalytic domain
MRRLAVRTLPAVFRVFAAIAVLSVLATGCRAPAAAPATSAPPTSAPPSTARPSSAPAPAPPPCARKARACVSLSLRKAWLMRRGVAEYGPVPIAHGRPASPTPAGTFAVSWKDADHRSSIYGTPMPYAVFFAPDGIAFHQGDVRTGSHGCVRLTMAAARVFFNRLRPGEIVQVLP